MPTQVSLLDGALASAGTLAIQTNGTTSAITISSAQVATFVNNPIMTGLTASRAVFTDGSKGLTSNAITGTGNVVMSASPTLTGTIDGAALTLSSSLTLSGGTANGVLYLNGSKVATSGSALTFDGTNLGVGVTPTYPLDVSRGSSGVVARFASTSGAGAFVYADSSQVYYGAASGVPNCFVINNGSNYVALNANGSEGARLTSTGLGVGTSSPSYKLHVNGYVYSGSGFVLLSQASGGGNIFEASGNTGIDFGTTSNTLSFTTSGSTRMRLDSSGNLGLGVTPNTWAGTGVKAFQFQNGALAASSSFGTMLSWNAYYDGSYKYTASTTAGMYQVGGAHTWYTAPSGTAGGTITFTQAMTLDASGNLGIGTTSPADILHISKAGDLYLRVANTSTGINAYLGQDSNGTYIGNTGASVVRFIQGGSERARITSTGDLYINTTSAIDSAYKVQLYFASGGGITIKTGTNGDNAMGFRNSSGTSVGSIVINASSTAYNTSSDYRLKNTIAPMTGALAKVAQLKPCTYKWNADGSDGEGFIAHELQEVVPQCVTGEKDAVDAEGNPVYQGIDTSFLVATLTAAIQELKAEVDSLKAQLNKGA